MCEERRAERGAFNMVERRVVHEGRGGEGVCARWSVARGEGEGGGEKMSFIWHTVCERFCRKGVCSCDGRQFSI